MKFPGGFNIQQMMKQAQVMQEKMQKEMEELRVEASSGGGVVSTCSRPWRDVRRDTYPAITTAASMTSPMRTRPAMRRLEGELMTDKNNVSVRSAVSGCCHQ